MISQDSAKVYYSRTAVYNWMINRIRSVAAACGVYSSVCTIGCIATAIAILTVISLIPLYLNKHGEDALGEVYCINNYTLTVGFKIPQYVTTFNSALGAYLYTISGGQTNTADEFFCASTYTFPFGSYYAASNLTSSGTLSVSDSCYYTTTSIISPSINGAIYDSYALSEACYRTLQSCNYDPLLTSCILSSCFVVSYTAPSTTAAYPLTYYTIRCTANIYYKTRCLESPVSYGYNHSSSQQNSYCREQRLNRINSCLNSSVPLLDVPCLTTVSSGLVTSTYGTCTQYVSYGASVISSVTGTTTTYTVLSLGISPSSATRTASFSNPTFTASDQASGHIYQIANITSQTYASNQAGAIYCGAVTHTQIASSVNAALVSTNSG